MSFASRLVTALLGLALIFLFWPIGMPVGFQQAWWAREQVIGPVTPPPAATPDKRLFTKPAAAPERETPKAPHAIEAETAAPKPEPQPQANAKANPEDVAKPEHTAALKKTDEVAITPPLTSKRYYRVVVRDGGTIAANGIVIGLADINARDADAKCKDARGRTWPCGARARAALTRLIRGRAIVCKVPASGKPKSLTARCAVAGTDLSTWMVMQGWAKPKASAEPKLVKAAEAAQKKKIGLWR